MSDITPSPQQAEAIKAIGAWYDDPHQQEFLLDGEAGTGKSTIAALAVEALKERRRRKVDKVLSGAYTAKAAHVMRRKGMEGAQTIHSMIYRLEEDGYQPRFVLDANGPASNADLIVLDECSMVNTEMAQDLRSFGKKILVLGDKDGQLPPVSGAGAFTERAPDFRLTEPHRFALESPIIQLAMKARRGHAIQEGNWGDGVEVVNLTPESWRRIYRPETQVVCGINRARWAICQLLRKELGFDGPVPAAGERIICCRNKMDLGLFNGAFGVTTQESGFDDESGNLVLSVRMEGHGDDLRDLQAHPYLFRQHFVGSLERPLIQDGALEFDWAYAITCHKAQGSEWPHVTVVDDSRAFRTPDMMRRWLYTAITRAAIGLTVLRRAA